MKQVWESVGILAAMVTAGTGAFYWFGSHLAYSTGADPLPLIVSASVLVVCIIGWIFSKSD